MKTIVWDVDDVLNDLMRGWFEMQWRKAHPGCTLTYEQISENPPHRVLGATLAQYQESLDSFRITGFSRLPPNPVVLAWFHEHGTRFRHVALTSVPLSGAGVSASWVLKHFGSWIHSFNVVPSPRDGDSFVRHDRTKAGFLEWWGQPVIMIDDNYETIQAVRKSGFEAILVSRPWNAGGQTMEDVLASLSNMR
jgi:phosphoglycolate phosphatase-like HAD superfamily hydrolase